MTQKQSTAHERIFASIRGLMVDLEALAGWKEWRQAKVSYTLWHDDVDAEERRAQVASEFLFPAELEKRHAVLVAYLELADGVAALRDCEYYFRRYPFRGLPVSPKSHLTYACEMYFNRFYEIRSRIKNTLNAANELIAPKRIDVGAFIKLFDKAFDSELRQRNSTHHHDRFSDVSIDRLFLTEAMSTASDAPDFLVQARRREYRRLAGEWAVRVRKKSGMAQQFLDAVANAIEDSFPMPKATTEAAAQALARDMDATLGPTSPASKGSSAD